MMDVQDAAPAGVLRLIHRSPRLGPGVYRDGDGNRWHVRAVAGDVVVARREADAGVPYHAAGSTPGVGVERPNPVHEWLTYRVEAVY
jgi:hypothetical protein